MRPDNPNFLPCASYKHIGFEAVGPGWEQILVDLDHKFVMLTGLGTSEHTKIEVLQIKEKFGGLRVYVDASAFDEEKRREIYEATYEAERESFKTCEKCGSKEGIETRNKSGQQFGRVLTLCGKCHEERDNLPADQRFELGNGQSTV